MKGFLASSFLCAAVSLLAFPHDGSAAPVVSKGAVAAGIYFVRCVSPGPTGEVNIYYDRNILVQQGNNVTYGSVKRQLKNFLRASARGECEAPARITDAFYEIQGRAFGSRKECGPGQMIVDDTVPSVRAIAVRYKPFTHRAHHILYGWGWRFRFPATDAADGAALLNDAIGIALSPIPPFLRTNLDGSQDDQSFESDLDAFTCQPNPACGAEVARGLADNNNLGGDNGNLGGNNNVCRVRTTPSPSDIPEPVPSLPPAKTATPTPPPSVSPTVTVTATATPNGGGMQSPTPTPS